MQNFWKWWSCFWFRNCLRVLLRWWRNKLRGEDRLWVLWMLIDGGNWAWPRGQGRRAPSDFQLLDRARHQAYSKEENWKRQGVLPHSIPKGAWQIYRQLHSACWQGCRGYSHQWSLEYEGLLRKACRPESKRSRPNKKWDLGRCRRNPIWNSILAIHPVKSNQNLCQCCDEYISHEFIQVGGKCENVNLSVGPFHLQSCLIQ